MTAEKRETTQDVWYAGGLRFACTRCSRCCGGGPGYVWVVEEETRRMATYLGMAPRQFEREFCRQVWVRTSLKEKSNGDCVLLSRDGCSVYSVRPMQCQTFPFWPDIVEDRARWQAVSRRCPGIGRGRRYSREEIDRIAERRRST